MEIHSTKIKLEIVTKCFPRFDNALCNLISEAGQWISLEPGDVLVKEDDYIKSFPLVLEGSIKIFRTDNKQREILLYYLSAGQVCSMALICCMENIKSNINAIAETDCEIVRIPVYYLEKWMAEYSAWKQFIMYSYKQRFDELLETIDSIAFRKMDARLIKFFSDVYRTTGNTIFNGKHQDIADALTSSREVISRLLKHLEREGKIVLDRNKIDFSQLF